MVAKFHVSPEGFFVVRAVLKTGLAENLNWQHIGDHYWYHFGGRETYHLWWDSVGTRDTKTIRSPCSNRVGCRCLLRDSARPHIALTIKFVFVYYKQKTQLHPAYGPQMISPDFGIFAKPKEPLRGQRSQSLETLNATVADLSDSLAPVDS